MDSFDPESFNFDTTHAFLSSTEAEIILFLKKKAAILVLWLLQLFYKYFNMAPLPELKTRPQRPLIPKSGAFIHSVKVILLTDPANCSSNVYAKDKV